jgi:hypothetical protein
MSELNADRIVASVVPVALSQIFDTYVQTDEETQMREKNPKHLTGKQAPSK